MCMHFYMQKLPLALTQLPREYWSGFAGKYIRCKTPGVIEI